MSPVSVSYVSFLTTSVSCRRSTISRLLSNVFCLFHVSCLTTIVLHLLSIVLLTSPVSLMSPVCLMSPICLTSPVVSRIRSHLYCLSHVSCMSYVSFLSHVSWLSHIYCLTSHSQEGWVWLAAAYQWRDAKKLYRFRQFNGFSALSGLCRLNPIFCLTDMKFSRSGLKGTVARKKLLN